MLWRVQRGTGGTIAECSDAPACWRNNGWKSKVYRFDARPVFCGLFKAEAELSLQSNSRGFESRATAQWCSITLKWSLDISSPVSDIAFCILICKQNIKQNKRPTFHLEKCCHLTMCSHLMEPNRADKTKIGEKLPKSFLYLDETRLTKKFRPRLLAKEPLSCNWPYWWLIQKATLDISINHSGKCSFQKMACDRISCKWQFGRRGCPRPTLNFFTRRLIQENRETGLTFARRALKFSVLWLINNP